MRRTLLIGFALVALLSACGEERALLEVELELPRTGGVGTRVWAFAEVQAEAEGDFFWPPGEGVAEQLLAEPATMSFGVPATRDTGMRLRVSFCFEEDCSDPQDALGQAPQVGYRIERSHYLLETTRMHRAIESIPPGSEAKEVNVGKCEIEGCWAGDAISWCERDGRHACE